MDASDARLDELLRHDGFVRGLARRLILDPDAAEDLAQEAWVAALEGPREGVASLPRWLSGVVRHLAARSLRGGGRREARERRSAVPETTPSTAEILAREAARSRLVQGVLELEEPLRAVLVLRYFEGLPPRPFVPSD